MIDDFKFDDDIFKECLNKLDLFTVRVDDGGSAIYNNGKYYRLWIQTEPENDNQRIGRIYYVDKNGKACGNLYYRVIKTKEDIVNLLKSIK